MISKYITYLIAPAIVLTGCASKSDQYIDHSTYIPATNISMNQRHTKEDVTTPLPGQLMPIPNKKHSIEKNYKTKQDAVKSATKRALRYPSSDKFINSTMIYGYTKGALYTVYSSPGQVTDIELEKNEKTISFASGDTINWLIQKTYSGKRSNKRQHLLVKPLKAGINTTLVLMTDQRIYHIKLISTQGTYNTSVSWRYPNDSFVKQYTENQSASRNMEIDMNDAVFNYNTKLISGIKPSWYPSQVFSSDGKTYIKFPNAFKHSEAPILLVSKNNRSYSPMINYRIKGNYMIIDGLFKSAKLQSGNKANKDKSDRLTAVVIYQK